MLLEEQGRFIFAKIICPSCGGFVEYLPHKLEEATVDGDMFKCAHCRKVIVIHIEPLRRDAQLRDEADKGGAATEMTGRVPCPQCGHLRYSNFTIIEKCKTCGDAEWFLNWRRSIA